ncbi:unnamed protein product, partial [Gongylonema pulchrum]|uniref:Thymidine kinase n=1 Tax=Gongylonema pulchrum TaxID=637853 RepID=A0A183EYD4_9BILA
MRRHKIHSNDFSFNGRIEVIFGPMFSGKTTELLRRRRRHALANRSCKVVKYAGDTRYSDCMVTTHDQIMQDAISASRIEDVFEELLKNKVVLIDEGQFFPDIVEYSELLANLGKIVIVSSLDGDFKREEFQSKILDLCSLAEDVVKLKAVCTECSNDASFTCRISSEKK